MTRDIIEKSGIVPVVTVKDAETAVPIAKALLKGGITVIEITFRTEAAEEALRRIAEEVEEITVGAGTVRRVEQLEKALEAGARFIVTPGFNRKTVESAVKRHIPIYPGVMTPGEIENVAEYGICTAKFFPAEASGGTAMLKAFAGPYEEMKFIPTGGVGEKNFEEYLALDNVIAVGGSWITKRDQNGKLDYGLIEERASQASGRVSELRGN